ncbi:ATPase [Chryseobacterium shigense]|uniref:Predicted ATPase n=1 Tax=Chryseobacterium shigense TaxID=297244 RepID=A0A1N7I864_9FLAO|nr:AAA family ATPase [Chryseobacterium shigense]PQA97014.1 ATPase [Chryseobacterium shigense]SIS33212.1 Predicted ATPase [Chryseobacterium shigense]
MLKNKSQHLFVITGGPGAGKTTLLNALEIKGKRVIPEDARQIIKQQMQINGEGLPWKNKILYAELMFEASLKTYQKVTSEVLDKTVFFDRGILDSICYMEMENITVSDELLAVVRSNPYNQKVFILPPWLDIYETDNERKQTWKEAVYTFDLMKQTYTNFGYKVIEVPKETTDKRCDFIFSNI